MSYTTDMLRLRRLATAAALAALLLASCKKEAGVDSGNAPLCIYQVMTPTFIDGDSSIGYQTAWGPEEETGGDLQGVMDSLDYIKSLGCNAVWLTPVFDSSGANSDSESGYSGRLDSTGYYTKDYFHIDPHFGSEETFRKLVDCCHEAGLYVILDGVFGHWGDFVEPSPSGRLPSREHGKFHGASFPESLEFFQEVAAYWIREYKIDGWRLDQCYQLGTDGEGVHDGRNYWYDIRLAVEAVCRENRSEGSRWGTLGYLVGECWKDTAREIRSSVVDPGTAEGYGLASCFDFPSRGYISRIMTKDGTNAGGLLNYVFSDAESKGYPGFYKPNLFLDNHDLDRLGTSITEAYPAQRPDGEESSTYYAKHALALAILAAYSGPVTVYYGDEWGAWLDPARIGSFPCYRDNSSRTAGKQEGFSDREQELLDYVSSLLNARKNTPVLYEGKNETLLASKELYIGKKTLGKTELVYLLNCSASPQIYTLEKGGKDIISGRKVGKTGTLAPWSALFIRVKG